MSLFFEQNLILLAKSLEKPLYAVGGVVRNYLIDGSISEDFDLASGVTAECLREKLGDFGFSVCVEYKRTGTLVFTDGRTKYEFTTFRTDNYQGGAHKPDRVEYTDSIEKDALRRDFACNAVYMNVATGELVDPLKKGVKDIEKKRLDTVTDPDKVFAFDGLRLLRLARFAGELNFKPTEEVLRSALKFSKNILEISPERIYAELKRILVADKKYAFSDKSGHYTALKILDKTRVLDQIFPCITNGRGIKQRADYHKYDVLEHSLKCAFYAPEKIRLVALLHDAGKAQSLEEEGNFYRHAELGVFGAKVALERLKADNKTIEKACFLIRWHMLDIDGNMGEKKLRLFFVKNKENIFDLMDLKRADFMASKDGEGTSATLKKWQAL